MKNQIKTVRMNAVQILKNGKVVKEFESHPMQVQSVFNSAVNIAGGMWNGKDTFKVVIK